MAKRGKDTQAAAEELVKAKGATTDAVEAEAQAAAWVWACEDKQEYCQLKSARLAFEVACEATVGIPGHGQLEAKMRNVAPSLEVAGHCVVRQPFRATAAV